VNISLRKAYKWPASKFMTLNKNVFNVMNHQKNKAISKWDITLYLVDTHIYIYICIYIYVYMYVAEDVEKLEHLVGKENGM
jgi:hypothetical protein